MLSFRLPVFTRRARRHLASHPKFYWFDCGIFRAARPMGPLDRPAELGGPALEGLVVQHLRAWNDLGKDQHSLAYWRTKAGNEVDLVVHGPMGFWAIEVKHAGSVQPADLRGLRAFLSDYPEARGLFLYRGRDRLRIDNLDVINVGTFLRELRPGEPLVHS